jgi:HK97 family phage major capsid protein
MKETGMAPKAPTDPIQLVKANWDARMEHRSVLTEIDDLCTKEQRDYTDDERAKVDEARSALDGIDERIATNIKAATRDVELRDGISSYLGAVVDQNAEIEDHRSFGERVAASDEFRSWAEGHGKHLNPVTIEGMDFRAVTDVTTGSTSGGAFVQAQRLGRVGQDFLDRKTWLIDLLPRIPISGPVEYVQDQSPLADLANKAAEVAETSAKPQAGPTLAVISESPAVIATWFNMTRQAASDAPQLAGYLDSRGRYSLKRRADGQVINGDGNSPNLSGLLDRSGILTEAPGSAEARAVTIRKAITTMEEADAVPEIVVLNPGDHELFDLLNLSSAGINAVPNLQSAPSQTAWGLRVVKSNAIASGTAMLIDPMATAVLDRQQPTAYTTDSHGTNFTSNILTMLLELRLGLALFDPDGVLKVTFNGTT